MRGAARFLLALAALAAAPLLGAPRLQAQVDPTLRWRRLDTRHFRILYSPGLEEHARRTAVNAERAWDALAAELHAPRGPVELVLADNVDFTNGYATTFPRNRIVLYAHPPVDTRSLRFYDDWNALVVTHELTHIFHLDRTRGWWRGAQWVFGRNPLLFPNGYTPAWLTEGLAVYYESRLTGSGRLVGSEHRMLARATALERHVPRLDELSLATSRYPGGEAAYAYGSLVFDYLARTRGADRVPAFIERASGTPVPFFSNVPARRAFGVSFSRAWADFRDSVTRAESGRGAVPPVPGWRDLTHAGYGAVYPRWLDSARVLYAGTSGRETPGAYAVDLGGRRRRLGRRNGLDANAPLPGGGVVYSQVDLTDPYSVRSDLWVQRGGRERRLTRGARLAAPDARADGRLVAVQAVPAGTRLVLVSADGRDIRPLTAGGPDEQWAEPRWSPDGQRIAAVRWTRGGTTAIAIVDTTGAVLQLVGAGRVVNAVPAWTPDGRGIVFSSDRSGTAQLYVAALDAPGAPRVLSRAVTGLFQPDVSPDGRRLAASLYRARGEYIGVGAFDSTTAAADTVVALAPDFPAAGRSDAPTRPYRPWGDLLPRYWMPILGAGVDAGSTMLGASTSASDPTGRHRYDAQATWDTRRRDLSFDGVYSYARFRQPALSLGVLQDWSYASATRLAERRNRVTLGATFQRPRARSSSYLLLGAEAERFTYRNVPPLSDANPWQGEPLDYLTAVASAGWNDLQRPSLAISPEDGVALTGTLRQRSPRASFLTRTRSATGHVRLYKSLDLPGYAHHVLALRLAGGWADRYATSLFSAGGTSGGSLEVVPGVVIGDEPRLFAVRGFPSGAEAGTRAAAASAEWRAPLFMANRGLGLVPVFFDRASLSAFADAGAAWCGGASTYGGCRPEGTSPRAYLASVGAELVLDFALQYDVAYRARLGFAAPVRGSALVRPGRVDPLPRPSLYLTFGSAF